MATQKLHSGRQIKKTNFTLNAYDKAFEKGFQLTLEYKKKFGKPNAPQRYKTPDGYNLGEWQKTQKKNYKKGVLTQDRVRMLDEIGFEWGLTGIQLKERWDFWYALTLKYRDENDTPNAPTKYTTPDGYKLGNWQVRQRESYSKKNLSLDRVKRLEGICFVWSKRREQRELSQKSKKRPEDIGFVRKKHDERFEKGFQKTLDFKKQHGNPNAPLKYKTHDGFRLGRWQSDQNKNYYKENISQERIKRLEEIGFIWRRQITNEELFEKGLQSTLEYKEQFGKPDAPLRYKTPDGYSLGTWQCNQRMKYKKGKLPAERVKRLNRIGFKWSLRKSKKKLL